jgi:autotransporter-associated beta strand protein
VQDGGGVSGFLKQIIRKQERVGKILPDLGVCSQVVRIHATGSAAIAYPAPKNMNANHLVPHAISATGQFTRRSVFTYPRKAYLAKALMIAASLGLTSLHAATGAWNTDADGIWSDAGNWTPGIADGATFTGNLTFNLTAARIVTLDSARSIGILNIGDTNTTHAYTLATGSNVLTFDNGAADAQLNQISTSNGDTVSGLLAIGGNGNLAINNAASGKTLTISAGITSSLASGTQNLTFNNANAVSVSGVIGNGVSGGTVALTKTGAGALTLSGANSFTGGLVIKSGAVTGSTNANSFGANTNVITIGDSSGGSANATLSGGNATYLNPITVASTNTGTATITTSGVNTTIFNGAITLNNHDLTVLGGYVGLTLGGGITGTGNVTLNSPNTNITINGALNYVGTFTNTGAGSPSNGNNINASFGTNVTSIIQNSATSAMTLYGNNSSYNNGIVIKKGQLSGSATNALGASTNIVTLGDSTGSSATTLGGKGSYANAIQVASGNTGTATITNTYQNSATFSGLVTLNSHDVIFSTQTGAGSQAVTMSGGTASTGTGGNLTLKVGGVHTLTVSGATGLNHVGSITNSGVGSFGAIISSVIGSNVTGVIQNSSTSSLTLGGANAYSGPTTVTLGTLATNATGTFGSSSVTVASGALLTLGNGASFGDLSTLTFASTSTASSINLNFTGADTLGAVYDSVSATYLAAGTYTASQLNTAFSSSVFAGTGSFTVAAIPEPSTYAAIFGGLALVGGVWRSRKRRG